MPASLDPVDRAHLTGRSRPSPTIRRLPCSPGFEDLVTRHWIPVWSLVTPQRQSTLQHPVALIVVSNTYARFYGVQPGLSTVTLEGDGWAFGTMLRPAAGRLLRGRSMDSMTGAWVDLTELDTLDGAALAAAITSAMDAAPDDPRSHERSRAALDAALRPFLPVDDTGRLVNRIVDWLTDHPEVTRVDEVARAFNLSERSLQRLVRERCGLSPKWLIQRRRLHDAVLALKASPAAAIRTTLGDLAAELGYTDQAHFTRDFRTVTGMTPGEYLADQG